MRFDLVNNTDTERMEFADPDAFVEALSAYDAAADGDDPEPDTEAACIILPFLQRNGVVYVTPLTMDDSDELSELAKGIGSMDGDTFREFAGWLDGCPDRVEVASMAYLLDVMGYSVADALDTLGAPLRFRLMAGSQPSAAEQHYSALYWDDYRHIDSRLAAAIDWQKVADQLAADGAIDFYEFAGEPYYTTEHDCI